MKRSTILIIIILTGLFNLKAQTLEEAKKLYLSGNYRMAMPAFEKAVNSSPKNASYNQWYGTCLLETGEVAKAEKYLTFAASKNVIEAYNSLGRMYYNTFSYEESADAYEKYIEFLTDKKRLDDVAAIKPLLARSQRAARMMSRCEDIQIIDSVVVNKANFLSNYLLSGESGTLQLSMDGLNRVVYENQLKDKRYYARLDSAKYYKLFSQSKLQNKWVDEKQLALPSDSSFNDNYPYVLSDGVTIYFASTGYGSIGGYDLFVTRYNLNTDTYLAPDQLGMPFNSPANDYMMAIDEFNGIGYFATDRFQPEDSVVIYTFIPNEEYKAIDSEDKQLLKRRSQITSIRDTWKQGVDYAALLLGVHNSINQAVVQKKKDFDFVINDNIVYYVIDDFESDAARQLFVKSQSIKKQIEDTELQLNDQRNQYAKGNASNKQTLTPLILKNEKLLNDLNEQYSSTCIKARNTEIAHLRQK